MNVFSTAYIQKASHGLHNPVRGEVGEVGEDVRKAALGGDRLCRAREHSSEACCGETCHVGQVEVKN